VETRRLTTNSIRSASLRLCWISLAVTVHHVVVHHLRGTSSSWYIIVVSLVHQVICDFASTIHQIIHPSLIRQSLRMNHTYQWSSLTVVSFVAIIPPKVLLSSHLFLCKRQSCSRIRPPFFQDTITFRGQLQFIKEYIIALVANSTNFVK